MENIPDTLISREWLCPNFFEIRDALERLEEEETEFFISWSRSYGYDITTDDPHMMVSHYQRAVRGYRHRKRKKTRTREKMP